MAHPSPVTLLNAGYQFYLTKLDTLIKSINKNPEDFSERTRWATRLEEWIGKAIEDERLITGAVK